MRMILVIVALTFGTGCWGGGAPAVSDPVLSRAITINNTTVQTLREIQEATRAMRKAALETIAKTAPSVAAGKDKMNELDERHQKLVALFQRCERAQNHLADLLELAQRAIAAGKAPNLDDVLDAYASMQALYAELTKEAATWTR